MKTDLNYKLDQNMRVRTCQAFKSQKVKKLNKTCDSIECSQSFFEEWILYQLYSDMTSESYGSVWTIDHCYPSSKTNQSSETDKLKTTCWIKSRPMYSDKKNSNGSKIDNLIYLKQERKAK